MTPRSALLAACLALAAAPVRAAAQLSPLTVPKGQVRFDLGGNLATWDRQFRSGQSESLAQDFTRDRIGTDFWPALRPGDSLLAKITGLPEGLNVGATAATRHLYVGTANIGVAWGVTSRLTVFGTVPYRRVQVRSSLAQDSAAANAGFNPADPTFGDAAGAAQANAFFAQFDAALGTLQRNLGAGFYDDDPAAKALAEQALAAGTVLRGDLHALLLDPATAPPFLPTASSALGGALLQRVSALQAIMAGLSVDGFTLAPGLPARRLGSDEFTGFVENGSGPVAGRLSSPLVTALGDVEAGVAYLLVDRRRPDNVSTLRVAAQALYRFPTAQLDDPSRFFDAGTGDRQPDLELAAAADLREGRFGGRLTAAYAIQLAGAAQQERIAPPSLPIPWAGTLAAVNWTPGSELRLGAQPFYAFSRSFAVTAGATWTRHAADQYALAAGQGEIPGSPVSQLAEESQASWLEAFGGLTLAAPFDTKDGKPHLPLDARLSYHTVVSATGGRVPRRTEVRFGIRYYARFP